VNTKSAPEEDQQDSFTPSVYLGSPGSPGRPVLTEFLLPSWDVVGLPLTEKEIVMEDETGEERSRQRFLEPESSRGTSSRPRIAWLLASSGVFIAMGSTMCLLVLVLSIKLC